MAFIAKMIENAKAVHEAAVSISDSPGAAPLHAAWRAGLKDLQSVVLSPIEGSMQTVSEPGSIANTTQALVTEQLKNHEPSQSVDMEM